MQKGIDIKLIDELIADPKWRMQLDDVRRERITGVLLNKLIEYSEQNRADKFIKDMYNELRLHKPEFYKLCPPDFIYAHNIREIDEQNIWQYLNYKELRQITKGIMELKARESPFYKFIKNIHVPYKFSMNIEMINDLRYDLVLRLSDIHPKNKHNTINTYKNILERTIESTTNPVLKSKLLLWSRFIKDEDLDDILKGKTP